MSIVSAADKITRVVAEKRGVVVMREPVRQVVAVGAMRGPAGKAGVGGADISTDAGNAITTGTDDGLYSPDDIASDPLAYYIIAKN
ncbi:MAG: hypothetical protein ACKO0Z_23115 [Betaproteobacteria bacterium]